MRKSCISLLTKKHQDWTFLCLVIYPKYGLSLICCSCFQCCIVRPKQRRLIVSNSVLAAIWSLSLTCCRRAAACGELVLTIPTSALCCAPPACWLLSSCRAAARQVLEQTIPQPLPNYQLHPLFHPYAMSDTLAPPLGLGGGQPQPSWAAPSPPLSRAVGGASGVGFLRGLDINKSLVQPCHSPYP
jgi:hypothetical protein